MEIDKKKVNISPKNGLNTCNTGNNTSNHCHPIWVFLKKVSVSFPEFYLHKPRVANGTFSQQMLTFGTFWHLFWQLVLFFCHFCHCLATVGTFWHLLATFGIFGQRWASLPFIFLSLFFLDNFFYDISF